MNLKRQGDLIFKPIKEKVRGKRVKEATVALGEITGHKHQLQGDVIVTTLEDGLVDTFEILGSTKIVHEEHNPITFPVKTKYKVLRKQEYDPFQKAMRQVVD